MPHGRRFPTRLFVDGRRYPQDSFGIGLLLRAEVMTSRDRWTVLWMALICGVGGPAIGVLVFLSWELWQGDKFVLTQTSLTGMVIETISGVGAYWLGGVVLFGPGAVALGGVGTWLLLKKRCHGASPQALRGRGIALGVVLGAMCPPLYVIWLSLLSLIQGAWLSPAEWARPWMEPASFPSIAAFEVTGMTTGLILGYTVAHRLARRVRNTDE